VQLTTILNRTRDPCNSRPESSTVGSRHVPESHLEAAVWADLDRGSSAAQLIRPDPMLSGYVRLLVSNLPISDDSQGGWVGKKNKTSLELSLGDHNSPLFPQRRRSAAPTKSCLDRYFVCQLMPEPRIANSCDQSKCVEQTENRQRTDSCRDRPTRSHLRVAVVVTFYDGSSFVRLPMKLLHR
jgi:hypothetical protein